MDTYEYVLAALADPTRRAVLEALARGPRPVGELAGDLPVSRPAVSQHLKVLSEAGLVRAERQGTRRVYHVEGAGLLELQRYLAGFWGRALAAFKERADAEADGDRRAR